MVFSLKNVVAIKSKNLQQPLTSTRSVIGGIKPTNPCLPSLDCVLGPVNDEEVDKDKTPPRATYSYPPPTHPFPHNAFHVWDQDDVVIPLPHDENPQVSPLLMAAIPYIPSFFPHSPTSHNSMNFSSSPSATQGLNIPREV